jgi:hypothetical protein
MEKVGISSVQQLRDYKYWTTGDGDMWMVESWCEYPTATLRRIDLVGCEDRATGAIGSLNLGTFIPVIAPKLERNPPGDGGYPECILGGPPCSSDYCGCKN